MGLRSRSRMFKRRESPSDPPLLIGSLFYPKDPLVIDETRGIFNEEGASSLLSNYINVCSTHGVRCTVDVEGSNLQSLTRHLEFVLGKVPHPVLADAPTRDLRLGVLRWAEEMGVLGRIVLNAIDYRMNVEELAPYEELAGLVISVFSPNIGEKLAQARKLLHDLLNSSLSSKPILLDLAVLDLPDLRETLGLIPKLKEELPDNVLLGLAPANVVPTFKLVDLVWEEVRGSVPDFRKRIGTVLRSVALSLAVENPSVDFIFFGPLREYPYHLTTTLFLTSRGFRTSTSLGQRAGDLREEFLRAIVELREEAVDIAERLLDGGLDPAKLAELLREGMNIIGEKYERGEYFISELILAGEIGERVVELIERRLGKSRGAVTVVLGTVEGDIHSIGKNIVKMMLMSNGFNVIDLGVDVPPERFVEAVKKYNARVVGMSALLTTTALNMKRVIEALEREGLRDKVVVMVGGAAVSEEFARRIGADIYAEDAIEAVRKLREYVGIE